MYRSKKSSLPNLPTDYQQLYPVNSPGQNQPKYQFTTYAAEVLRMVKQMLTATGLLTLVVMGIIGARLYTAKPLSVSPVKPAEVFNSEPSMATASATLTFFKPGEIAVIQGELFKISFYINSSQPAETPINMRLTFPTNQFKAEQVMIPGESNTPAVINNQAGTIDILNLTQDALTTKPIEFIFKSLNQGEENIAMSCVTAEDSVLPCPLTEPVPMKVKVIAAAAAPQKPACTQIPPFPPIDVNAQPGPGLGEVTLTWRRPLNTTTVSVFYGQNKGIYPYGMPNVGSVDRTVITQLTPGQGYYFILKTNNDCASSAPSLEVSTRAGYGGMTQEVLEQNKVIPPVAFTYIPTEATLSAQSQPVAVVPAKPALSTNEQFVAEPAANQPKAVSFWSIAGLLKSEFGLLFGICFVLGLALVLLLKNIRQSK
jgi:hypothetical protein